MKEHFHASCIAQEAKNSTYSNDLREHYMDIRAIKNGYAKMPAVKELLKDKANFEDLDAIRDQITTMPTTAGMELRFKQISNDMENLTVRMRRMFV